MNEKYMSARYRQSSLHSGWLMARAIVWGAGHAGQTLRQRRRRRVGPDVAYNGVASDVLVEELNHTGDEII